MENDTISVQPTGFRHIIAPFLDGNYNFTQVEFPSTPSFLSAIVLAFLPTYPDIIMLS
jgi:hypothetical protein